MYIKRFIGKNTKEALKAVKDELGSGVLILDSKRLERGRYEVLAAVDYDEDVRRARKITAVRGR